MVEKTRNVQDARLNAALKGITEYRAELADFLNRTNGWPEELTAHCNANDWNDQVAYDLKDALYKIGTVVACLYRWENSLGVENPFATGGRA